MSKSIQNPDPNPDVPASSRAHPDDPDANIDYFDPERIEAELRSLDLSHRQAQSEAEKTLLRELSASAVGPHRGPVAEPSQGYVRMLSEQAIDGSAGGTAHTPRPAHPGAPERKTEARAPNRPASRKPARPVTSKRDSGIARAWRAFREGLNITGRRTALPICAGILLLGMAAGAFLHHMQVRTKHRPAQPAETLPASASLRLDGNAETFARHSARPTATNRAGGTDGANGTMRTKK